MRRRRVLLNPNSAQCKAFGNVRVSNSRRKTRAGTRARSAVRTNWLKENGFADYEAYIASPKWAEVRQAAFAAKGRRCVCCWEAATQIHHSRYTDAAFAGTDLQPLHPVCSNCHEIIHRGGSLTAANKAMWQLMSKCKRV